jgi:hypothetical protein
LKGIDDRRRIKKSPNPKKGALEKLATTYSPTIAVPSAQAGLTSLFGMGRGGLCRYSHHKVLIRRSGYNFIKDIFEKENTRRIMK